MYELYQALAKAEQAHNTTNDLQGRSFGVSLGVVADVTDPMALGRIKVALPSKGAKTLTDWLVRLTPSKLISVPLVNVGDTVAVAFINGDPSQGVYLGAINNLPQPPANEITNTVLVNGSTFIVQTKDDITMTAGNASLKLDKDGNLSITGANTVTINGKHVATIDATDTRGDRLVTRGY